MQRDRRADEKMQEYLTRALGPLMEDIYQAVGVRVSFQDLEDKTLAETDFQCEFCRRSIARPEHLARCRACSREAKLRARDRGGVYFYRCWRGLMSAVIHVADGEESLGWFVLSGFVSTPEVMAATEQLLPDPAMQISAADMASIQFFYHYKVQDIVKTVSIAGSYLVEAHRRELAERAQRQAEYRALQSQISPHFLFNTLNSISQMAVLEGAETAPEAIYSMAKLLRRSMKQNLSLVPLMEELEFAREYMRIKQLLGRGEIRYCEEMDPGAEEILIPAFSVQPLVENAVNHGLEAQGRSGTVSVTASLEEGFLYLCVTDDGAGFDPAQAVSRGGGEISGIGIANVVERMRLFFGAKFEHSVVSAPGEGTSVCLRIPVEA